MKRRRWNALGSHEQSRRSCLCAHFSHSFIGWIKNTDSRSVAKSNNYSSSSWEHVHNPTQCRRKCLKQSGAFWRWTGRVDLESQHDKKCNELMAPDKSCVQRRYMTAARTIWRVICKQRRSHHQQNHFSSNDLYLISQSIHSFKVYNKLNSYGFI